MSVPPFLQSFFKTEEGMVEKSQKLQRKYSIPASIEQNSKGTYDINCLH
jgi:hypothetical protein